jgi:hypothetical protein
MPNKGTINTLITSLRAEPEISRDILANVLTRLSNKVFGTTSDSASDIRVAARKSLVFDPLSLGMTLPPWTSPSLQNLWVYWGSNFGTPGYYKGPDQVVRLRGLVKNGNFSVPPGSYLPIFTLPAGFTPQNELLFVATANGAPAEIRVTTGGQVCAVANAGTTNAYVSLDGISFRV